MEIQQLKMILSKILTPEKYKHSIGVMEMAVKLAEHYEYDLEKARLAGLLHDIAKGRSNDEYIRLANQYGIELDEIYIRAPKILHGAIGAKIVKNDIGIEDEEILHAIEVHTTGCLNMSLLDKIIYMADYIEVNRTEDEIVDLQLLRETAFKNIDEAMVIGLDNVLKHLLEQKEKDIISVDTVLERNRLILELCKN